MTASQIIWARKSELKVKKCDAMNYRCEGMRPRQEERWLIMKKKNEKKSSV